MVPSRCEMADRCWHDLGVVSACDFCYYRRRFHCDHCQSAQLTAEFGPPTAWSLAVRHGAASFAAGPASPLSARTLALLAFGRRTARRTRHAEAEAIGRIYVKLIQPVAPTPLAEMRSFLAFQGVQHSFRNLLAAAWGPHG